jgi:hypothetical protein
MMTRISFPDAFSMVLTQLKSMLLSNGNPLAFTVGTVTTIADMFGQSCFSRLSTASGRKACTREGIVVNDTMMFTLLLSAMPSHVFYHYCKSKYIVPATIVKG